MQKIVSADLARRVTEEKMDKELIDRLLEISESESALLSELERESQFDRTIKESRLHRWENDISLRIHTRFLPFPAHNHDFVELMTVVSGSITHRIGGQSIILGEGDILMMNKHVVHSIDATDERDIGINIIISDAFLAAVAPDLADTVFKSFVKENSNPQGEPAYLHFSTAGNKQICNLTENLIMELSNRSFDRTVLTGTVSLLLRYLSLQREALLRGGVTYGKREARRLQISSYISSSYRSASLSELARQTYLSEPYLSRIIKETFGIGFKELLISERMRRAEELIQKTDMPISAVIRSVGYDNESYFHREFKSRFGTSPLAMRKEARAESKGSG